jgi:hypothetical protein
MDGSQYWILDRDFVCIQFSILPDERECLNRSRTVQLGRPSKLRAPLVCASLNESLLMGKETGQLLVCSWNGASPSFIEITRKPIQVLSLSLDRESAILCDSESIGTFVNLKTFTITRCPKKSSVSRFVSPEIVLDKAGLEATYRPFPSHAIVDPPTPARIVNHIIFKSPEVREREALSVRLDCIAWFRNRVDCPQTSPTERGVSQSQYPKPVQI